MKLFILIIFSFFFSFKSNNSTELINLIHKQIKEGKRLIAFGETHQHKSLHDLIENVLGSKQIQNDIDIIIVEFGNSFYQKILDQYISGEDISIDDIKVVWRNTLISPNTIWDSPVYERFFKTIREINKSLKSTKKYRVIAAGKSTDWSKINTKEEMIFYKKTNRTEHMFNVVGNEVFIKNKTAILIAGGWHTTQLNLELKKKASYFFNDYSTKKPQDLYYPTAGFFISSYSKINTLGIKEIDQMKEGSIILTNSKSLADITGKQLVFMKGRRGRPDYNPYPNNHLKDMADALILWGPKENWVYERPLKETYNESVYWKELNRRSQLKWNRAMDKSLLE